MGGVGECVADRGPFCATKARPRMHARTKTNALWIAGLSSLAMGIFWAPAFVTAHRTGPGFFDWELLSRLMATGYGDWQWFHHMWEAGRTSIVRHGELPVFDPFHCGGVPLWGNPQAQVYSPTWAIFALPFGTTIGHKLYLLAHAIVGHAGMYLLCRRLYGLSQQSSFLAATIWAASGFFAWHGAGGHATFISFYWAPWLLLSWRLAESDLRHAAPVALIMGLVVAEGGHYPFPYFVLWLTFDLILRLVDRPTQAWPMLRAAMLSGGLAAFVCAYRILPILFTVLDHPHPVVDHDAITPDEILFMLTSHESPGGWPHRWVWNEYGGFVGWGVIGLAGLGGLLCLGAFAGDRMRMPTKIREPMFLVLGAVFFFLLTQGAASEHHPWPLLQELPFYRSIHVPSRFRVLLTFYLAGLSGVAFDAVRRWLAQARLPRSIDGLREALPVILLMGILINLYVVNLGINDRWDGAQLHGTEVAHRFHLLRERWSYLHDYADYPYRHVGTSECYDPIPWTISPRLWSGDGPQVHIDPPSAGRVIDSDRTSRTLWAEVELEGPAVLIFNQSVVPDFELSEGTLGERDGLLTAAIVTPGTRRVTLRYAPANLPWVTTLTVLGLLGCAGVWRGKRITWRGLRHT